MHHRYHRVACFPKVHCDKAIPPKDIRKNVRFCSNALDTPLGAIQHQALPLRKHYHSYHYPSRAIKRVLLSPEEST